MAMLAFLAMTFTVQLSAQQPGGQNRPPGQGRGQQMTEEDIEKRVDNMAETLEMTDEQHEKVLKFEMEFYTRMQVEREKHMDDRETMRAAMMEIRDERDKKYEEVLSPEQMTKLKEIQDQRREQMRQQRDQRPGGEGDERPARGRGRN